MSETRSNDTPGTAVALTPDAAEVKSLLKQAAPQDRLTRAMAREMANRQFGNALTPAEKGALAEWSFQTGIDLRHIVLLGGKIYILADWYMEQAAVVYPNSVYEWVNVTEEAKRRTYWGVPDFAIAAYELHFWRDRRNHAQGYPADVVEANWAPNKKTADPVGSADPHKTARTRAARRALRYMVPVGSARTEQLERNLREFHIQAKQYVAEPAPAPAIDIPDDPYMLGAGTAAPEPPAPEEFCRYCDLHRDEHADAVHDHPFTPPVEVDAEPSGFDGEV